MQEIYLQDSVQCIVRIYYVYLIIRTYTGIPGQSGDSPQRSGLQEHTGRGEQDSEDI